MSELEHPVWVAVTRADGSADRVRVGTAVRDGDGFMLRLGELRLGPATAAAARPSGAASGDGPVFPPYGRSKGAPIRGATLQDLEYYAQGARRSLADPGKARWHDKERALLATIEAEISRQRGEAGEEEPPLGEEPPF